MAENGIGGGIVAVQEPDLVLAGLERLLDEAGYVLQGVAVGAAEAVAAASGLAARLAIVGPRCGGSPRDVVVQLRTECPEVAVVVLAQGRPAWADDLPAEGAPVGLASIWDDPATFLEAIRTIDDGHDFPLGWRRSAVRPDAMGLTPAERRVLSALASTPDTRGRLAANLGVSTSTLDSQLASIKRKVGVELAADGVLPADGFVSTEALIGWAIGRGFRTS